jgi:hypothetical protein
MSKVMGTGQGRVEVAQRDERAWWLHAISILLQIAQWMSSALYRGDDQKTRGWSPKSHQGSGGGDGFPPGESFHPMESLG